MASCLGLYIEGNLIKYAKVSKEKDTKKVEAFGIKFCERLEEGVKQIIDETYSYKIPVCINLSEENYQYFSMFALLSQKDLDKAIKTEFDTFCADKGYNPNVFETRYAVVNERENEERLKVIFVAENKIELNKQVQLLQNYRLSGAYPLPIAITTLLNKDKSKKNCLIVNIEEKTTITTILNNKIYDVKVLEHGSRDFLDKINLKENSYQKAYEMCKETTIYTSDGKELTEEQTGYLEEIMPVLYPIVGQVQKVLNENIEKIENVYITGTASLINNVDLYFQEYLNNVRCEVLKPGFIPVTPDINIKDYIEVNSAIAIALMGLGEGIADMNFRKVPRNERLKAILNLEINGDVKSKMLESGLLTNDLKQPLDRIEKKLLNVVAGLLILFIVYSGFSLMLKSQFEKKNIEAEDSILNTRQQILLAQKDDNTIKQIKSDYTTKVSNIEALNKRLEEKNKVKGSIPTLLNQLMNIIPTNVQIKSIQNTGDRHIEILVESPKYEQIAFFIGSIKTEVVLTNVISTSGQKSNDVITVKIEGDLP
ncbi:MAG: hypothetical protein BHW01_05425 [Clostridium sp. 27_14]|nr:MAG: hypothetical protein BHW01_05425 [Clostridium sp. 27_14]